MHLVKPYYHLSAYQRSILALKLEDLFKTKAKEKQALGGKEKVPQKSVNPAIDTQKELAKVAGVSHDTIMKVKVIEEKALPEQKVKLQTGDTTINKVFKEIRREEKKVENEAKKQNSPALLIGEI